MRHAGAGAFITLLHSSHCKVDKRGRKHHPPFTPGSRSSHKRLFGATGHFCVRAQDCGSKMKKHSATTKQRSLASYFKKVRTDEANGEEPPPSKAKTSPSSELVESQARPNFCSDSGECTGLYESPENEHKQDTHAPLGNDGHRSATPSDLCSTVNAGQSDGFTTGQCPRKVSDMAPTHSGSPPLCATSANIFDLGLFVSKSNNVNDPETMEKLLLNPWTPPANYDYPATRKRNLKFQPYWVDRYPWLVYSEKLQGALCKYCVVFASKCAGKGEHQRLGCFVTKEFTKTRKPWTPLRATHPAVITPCQQRYRRTF
ncbi:hypothetical protein HPB51_010513 [Rhipicephalus microplus]|uniref:TTF-type domain-containing protein n=1 Tax=Rhipicephalus microplus TaxID=6941 RepID=A0A9J6DA33_RHIMP|nr:hypothetical protein HPB51_010513 [Rhipicephalus microplus]